MDLEYYIIDDGISLPIIYELIYRLKEDKKIELIDELPDGRLNHIVMKGTTIPIGYLGDDSLEMVKQKEKRLTEEICECQKHLLEIYKRATNKIVWENIILTLRGLN